MRISKNTINIVIIVLLCFAAYANTLFNGFVWDDEEFIVNRPEIRDLGSTLNSLGGDQYGIYRPLRTIFYHFSYELYGLNPTLYHLQAIILHALASVLIYLIRGRNRLT